MLCILNVVPGDVDITDVRCGAVNLINQCDVEWNVSVIITCVIVTCAIKSYYRYVHCINSVYMEIIFI